MPLSPKTRLGAYEIVCSLGAGGMGEVYRARDSRLGREVALKVLPPEVTNEPGRLERFDREARAIAALNHPHIITIYSTEEVDGVRFLTMELVEGCTLGDLVTTGGMAMPKFLEIAVPLADALAAAHQKQITHRDLKPGNVMVSSDGRVKVLDFGLARVGDTDAGEQTLIATQAPITHQGMIVGTMPYMSPEQVEGRPIDARSDLFSLGVIFYELLSGERPFKGSSSPALMSAILRDTPPGITGQRADVPDALDRLLSRLIEKRPEDRVQTARDVFNELRHLKGDRSTGVQRSFSGRAMGDSLTVAVLPFTVGSAAGEAGGLAAGLTEDVTTSLAKFPGLSVVASQSARAFKDSPLDVRQIAERVGARYMISGNVRQSGSAFRISAQLIDAHSGKQLWSETYDRRLDQTDLFAIQDDVTDHLVATVADESGVLAHSMVRSVQQTTIGESSDHQLIVQLWGLQHDPTPARHAELRVAFEKQVAAQPNNAQAWASLANLYVVEHSLWFNPLPDPLDRAMRAARRAIEIDRACQKGWLWLGITHFHLKDRRGLDEAFERAARINPRDANTMAWMGNILAHAGDYARGSALTERAMQINPGHPGWLHFGVFSRHYSAGAFEESLQAARRVNIPNFFWMQFAIAAACGQLGLAAEGTAAFEAMIRIAPAFADEANLREFVTRWYWDEAIIESLLEGVARSAKNDRTKLRSNDRHRPPSSAPDRPRSGAPRSTDPSIAVLPFTDLSEKKDQDWFCDGIAEEILTALATLPGLRVAARASAFSLRGKADDLTAIGEKLNVTTVLEGSVRRAGDRVRITAQLSDAREGRQLWSERFDRELKDIFDVQEQIARAIAERLRVTIIGGSARLVPQATTNIEAYELLLKGRAFVTRRGRAVLDAIPLFERAVELDPNLSEAHALLGDAHRLLGLYSMAAASDEMPRARACVERALALDPNQAEALATLAIIATVYEWNLAELRIRSDRTLQADPNHVRGLTERALSLAFIGQPGDDWQADAEMHIRKARALDPLNAWVMAADGAVQMLHGRIEEGTRIAQGAVELDRNNFTAHWFYTWGLAALGRDEAAIAASEPALAMSGRHPLILSNLCAVYASRGERGPIEIIHAELARRANATFVSPAARATVAAAAGRIETARELLAEAIAEHDPYLAFFKMYGWSEVWQDDECAAMIRATSLFKDGPPLPPRTVAPPQ